MLYRAVASTWACPKLRLHHRQVHPPPRPVRSHSVPQCVRVTGWNVGLRAAVSEDCPQPGWGQWMTATGASSGEREQRQEPSAEELNNHV
jgi:hypothetical protein